MVRIPNKLLDFSIKPKIISIPIKLLKQINISFIIKDIISDTALNLIVNQDGKEKLNVTIIVKEEIKNIFFINKN